MSNRNSKIIIAQNIKLDKNHSNVLNYTTNQMLQLLNSSGIYVAERNDYSFIRRTGTIAADFPYSAAVTCNYMAFQNPDFSNKWFFAWIDSIEYKSDNSIEIAYTIDNWATWYDDFVFHSAMVVREHVTDDTPGKHLVPEPIATDPVTTYAHAEEIFNGYVVVMLLYDEDNLMTPGQWVDNDVIINNTYLSPATIVICSADAAGMTLINQICTAYAGKSQDIISLTLYPGQYITPGDLAKVTFGATTNINAPNNYAGYTVQNNKLKTYPYTYIKVHTSKSSKVYKFEEFYDINENRTMQGVFTSYGWAGSPNPSVTCVPRTYGGYGAETHNHYEALTIGNFARVPYVIDSLQAWIAQNANANMLGAIRGVIGGAKSGGVYGAAGSMADWLLGQFQGEAAAADRADSVIGDGNTEIASLRLEEGFYFETVGLVPDRMKNADFFLSARGYAVNTIKVPNINSRQYWNFIQTEGRSIYGAMPETVIEDVNAIMNRGVTVWHGHDYMLNYFIGGTSMQNPII